MVIPLNTTAITVDEQSTVAAASVVDKHIGSNSASYQHSSQRTTTYNQPQYSTRNHPRLLISVLTIGIMCNLGIFAALHSTGDCSNTANVLVNFGIVISCIFLVIANITCMSIQCTTV
jgi:hypothetical protein